MKHNISNWPDIDLAEMRRGLREVSLEAYPQLANYTRAEVHEALQGQGGLFLASDMAGMLNLQSGMRVLDLGCGSGSTSLFLAKKYGVEVHAVDEAPSESLLPRAAQSGVARLITSVRADCKQLPFPEEYFDAVFCMNSMFYFGTDKSYPDYLLKFIKRGGELVMGSPCYRDELTANTPVEFLLEYPVCLSVHSPGWWKTHFEKSGKALVSHSELHPHGVQFWEDRIKFLLDSQTIDEMSEGRRRMIHDILRMLNRDHDGFVSHFMLHLRKFPRND